PVARGISSPPRRRRYSWRCNAPYTRLSDPLWWVFPREAAAAVPGHAAIGVDHDLASGQAAVAHRPTDDEAPGRIDMVGDALMIQHVRGDDGFDHVFEHLFADLRKRGARVMLGRHHHGIDACRAMIDILHGDLRFAIWTQVR